MPNWVTNNVVIAGPKETLELFKRDNLNFQKFHPRPSDENLDWYEWNVAHWGTKWEPENVSAEFTSDGDLLCKFETAWTPPTAFLTYLTSFWTGITITNTFTDEAFNFAGQSVITKGAATTTFIEPTDYSLLALRNFGLTHKWYDYTNYEIMLHSLNMCSDDSACACFDKHSNLKDVVVANVKTETYGMMLSKASNSFEMMT